MYKYRPGESKTFGLRNEEGTFCACSFWYIKSLTRTGQSKKAVINFDNMLSYANHLGLFGEQLNSQGAYLSNSPQPFTHLPLISAAFNLNRLIKAANNTEKETK